MKGVKENIILEQTKKLIHGPKHHIHYYWCIRTDHWHRGG
jgi:hypothetical protein